MPTPPLNASPPSFFKRLIQAFSLSHRAQIRRERELNDQTLAWALWAVALVSQTRDALVAKTPAWQERAVLLCASRESTREQLAQSAHSIFYFHKQDAQLDWMLDHVWGEGQWADATRRALDTDLDHLLGLDRSPGQLLDSGHLALAHIVELLFPGDSLQHSQGGTVLEHLHPSIHHGLLHELLPRCRALQERQAMDRVLTRVSGDFAWPQPLLALGEPGQDGAAVSSAAGAGSKHDALAVRPPSRHRRL